MSSRHLCPESHSASFSSKKDFDKLKDKQSVQTEAAAKSHAVSIAEHEILEGRISAADRMSAEAEKRCKEAETKLEMAQNAQESAEKACAAAERSALESAKRADAAYSQLEIERGNKEEAQDQHEQLQKESDRR